MSEVEQGGIFKRLKDKFFTPPSGWKQTREEAIDMQLRMQMEHHETARYGGAERNEERGLLVRLRNVLCHLGILKQDEKRERVPPCEGRQGEYKS